MNIILMHIVHPLHQYASCRDQTYKFFKILVYPTNGRKICRTPPPQYPLAKMPKILLPLAISGGGGGVNLNPSPTKFFLSEILPYG